MTVLALPSLPINVYQSVVYGKISSLSPVSVPEHPFTRVFGILHAFPEQGRKLCIFSQLSSPPPGDFFVEIPRRPPLQARSRLRHSHPRRHRTPPPRPRLAQRGTIVGKKAISTEKVKCHKVFKQHGIRIHQLERNESVVDDVVLAETFFFHKRGTYVPEPQQQPRILRI